MNAKHACIYASFFGSGPSIENRQRIKLRETLNNPESYKFYKIFIRSETDKASNILQQ